MADAPYQVPNAWTGDRIVFFPANQDTASLWAVRISSRDLRITEPPERLTFTTGFDAKPALAAGGLLAFASPEENVNVWSLSIDANRAAPAGKPVRLTDAPGADLHPSVSRDGRKLVFRSDRSGSWDLWIKDLVSGQEKALVTARATGSFTAMSSDGSKVAFQERTKIGQHSYFVIEAGSQGDYGTARRVCESCGLLSDLSADGQLLLVLDLPHTPYRSISSQSVATGQVSHMTRHASDFVAEPRFSPDRRWVAFHSGSGDIRRKSSFAPRGPA